MYFEHHPLLLFELKNVTQDGELIPRLKKGKEVTGRDGNLIYKTVYRQAFYKGLDFKIYNITKLTPYNRITIEGSLHKYWNNGAHNFNDFNISAIIDVQKDLKDKFNIDFVNCILRQLEIGINILPPEITKQILRYCLLHKTSELKSTYTKDEGNYKQTKNQRHFIKLYDKRTHYVNKGFEIDAEIFRIEKKWSKMVELNNKGIYTLNDLIKHDLLNFKSDLLNLWNDVLFYDWQSLKGLKHNVNYSNVIYWLELKETNYNNFKYHRNNLNNLIKKQPNNLKTQIANLISNKVDLLNVKTTQINPLSIGLKTVVPTIEKNDKNRRKCLVTGLNISMQKDSKLLSHTGIKYYKKSDAKVYNEIKRKYLSTKWVDDDVETQIKELAHNIRNIYNNRKVKQDKHYSTNQYNLFNLKDLQQVS
jgi:hypothetical protein